MQSKCQADERARSVEEELRGGHVFMQIEQMSVEFAVTGDGSVALAEDLSEQP